MKVVKPILLWSLAALIVYSIFFDNSGSSAMRNNPAYGDAGEYYADEAYEGCTFEDGSHEATVNYYNPNTGYSAEYSLSVEVEDCQVIRIDFPKGGWLDEDHIRPGEIDEDGNATIEDDQERIWEIHIDE